MKDSTKAWVFFAERDMLMADYAINDDFRRFKQAPPPLPIQFLLEYLYPAT